MSGTALVNPASAYSALAFTNDERVQVRKYCGYPMYGGGNSGFQSWRFFQAYGLMEYRLTNPAAEETQQIRYYVAQCVTLEAAVFGASDNLDTAKAAVWTHNPREVSDRMDLYRTWRMELCNLIGVPPGPGIAGAAGRCVV